MLFERWHILFEISLHVGKKFKSFEPGDKSDSLGLEGSSSSKDSVFFFFVWLCLHNSVPIGDVLGSRGLNIDPMCNLCQRGNETIEHLLRSCEVAQRFWQDLKFPQCLRDSFKLPFGKWLETNCQKEIKSDIMGLPWKILFVMGIWHIWLHRNEVTFKSGRVDNTSHMRCIKESTEFFLLGINCKVQKLKFVIPVG